MKNREKYSDEIREVITSGKSCDFMKGVVIPNFIDSRTNTDCLCESGDCIGCTNLFAFWLDGEYVEPPTNWSEVPVDTLVKVRNIENDQWHLRHFKGVREETEWKFEAWSYGMSSQTADGHYCSWKFCELVEDADDCNEATDEN